jgi:hypothetical protein
MQFEPEKTDFNTQQIGDDLRSVVLGGSTRLTLASTKTGNHRTYRVFDLSNGNGQEGKLHLVKVLFGSDNINAYVRLGMIFNGARYRHGSTFKKPWEHPTPSVDSKGHKAFEYFWERLTRQGDVAETLEVYIARQCTKCNRWLTTPESVKTGLGPVCSKRQ